MRKNPWPKGKSRKRSNAAKKAWKHRSSGRKLKRKGSKHLTNKKRIETVIYDLWEGFTTKEIAKKRHLTVNQVRRIAKEEEMPDKVGRPRKVKRGRPKGI